MYAPAGGRCGDGDDVVGRVSKSQNKNSVVVVVVVDNAVVVDELCRSQFCTKSLAAAGGFWVELGTSGTLL